MADDDKPKRPRAEDRDVRRFKTPPKGVIEQIARPSGSHIPIEITGEDSRPTSQDPELLLDWTSKKVRTMSSDLNKNTVATAKLEVRVDVMDDKIDKLSDGQAVTDRKVDAIKEDVVEAKTTLGLILEDVRDIKEVRKHREKVDIEADGHRVKVTIDDVAHEKKTGREVLVKRWQIYAGIVTVLGTLITALVTKGC